MLMCVLFSFPFMRFALEWWRVAEDQPSHACSQTSMRAKQAFKQERYEYDVRLDPTADPERERGRSQLYMVPRVWGQSVCPAARFRAAKISMLTRLHSRPLQLRIDAGCGWEGGAVGSAASAFRLHRSSHWAVRPEGQGSCDVMVPRGLAGDKTPATPGQSSGVEQLRLCLRRGSQAVASLRARVGYRSNVSRCPGRRRRRRRSGSGAQHIATEGLRSVGLHCWSYFATLISTS